MRVVTINLCQEFPGKKKDLIKKWITLFRKIKGDILLLQEIQNYNMVSLASALNLKILNINNEENTCVLINPQKLTIVDNFHVKHKADPAVLYVAAIHLTDIPALPHYLNGKKYYGSPLHYSLAKMLKLCAERRLPGLKSVFRQAKKTEMAILAGDFNEPSHFDLDIPTPVSQAFEKAGFQDTFRQVNSAPGYTWPAGGMYKRGPLQRIDFIYTKNVGTKRSKVLDTGLSDHKMVITDISPY